MAKKQSKKQSQTQSGELIDQIGSALNRRKSPTPKQKEIKVTYEYVESEENEFRVSRAFAVLFEEVVRRRKQRKTDLTSIDN